MHNNIAVCPLACPAGTFGFQGKHFLVIDMELLGFGEEGSSLGVEPLSIEGGSSSCVTCINVHWCHQAGVHHRHGTVELMHESQPPETVFHHALRNSGAEPGFRKWGYCVHEPSDVKTAAIDALCGIIECAT